MDKKIVTRFAPSPTGTLHVGAYRTALFNSLFARQKNGKFIMRIEDTDKQRSKKEYEENIYQSLKWLDLNVDETYRQSDRYGRHTELLESLIDKNKAYISKEEPTKEDQRDEVIRFKNPNTKITFQDSVRGEVTFDTTSLGDFIIAKSISEPLYHLAVVIDDYDSEVSHVIRGEDHISNTPRQILIQEALNIPRPKYAHIPLVLASDKSKLSKRNGAEAVLDYREKGFLPEALVNFMALLGWNPGNEKEVYSREELVRDFSLERVHKGGAVFNEEKLKWINREHIKKLPNSVIGSYMDNFLSKSDKIKERGWQITDRIKEQITLIAMERIEVFGDVIKMADNGDFDFLFERPVFDDLEKIIWKNSNRKSTIKHLDTVGKILEKITEDNFNHESVKEPIWEYAEKEGRGDVLWPLRYALSGKDKSPDPFTLTELLGRKEAITRVEIAKEKLEKHE